MPEESLFLTQPVKLLTPVDKIISTMSKRAICATCGEEIHNEREVVRDGITLCMHCAGDSYYVPQPAPVDSPGPLNPSIVRMGKATDERSN